MQNSQTPPATTLSPVTVFFTLMLCPLLMGIDFLGIGVALPSMTNYFSINMDAGHWLITLFAIGYVAFIITASRLADIYGRRTLFLWSVFLFGLSSLLVGGAVNFPMALLGRALQGLSAGSMIMTMVALITEMFSGIEKKNKMSSLVAMFGLGMAIGPLVGGFLIDTLSWRYLFLINIPISLLVWFIAAAKFPRSTLAKKAVTLDIPGIILFTIVLSVFALVVSQTAVWGALSTKSLLCHATWVIALIAFFVVEMKSSNPLITMSLFKATNFFMSNIIGIVLYFCLSSWIICSGIYFSLGQHYSAFDAGLTFLPFGGLAYNC